MSALDKCEPSIIRAFEKEGWQIEQKPFVLRFPERTVYADVSFQRFIDHEPQHIIVVEIKCFEQHTRDLQELYTAIGQYEYYRIALHRKNFSYPLYLAIPSVAYIRLTQDLTASALLASIQARLVIVDIQKEAIERWIP
jgi:hypothetical protein